MKSNSSINLGFRFAMSGRARGDIGPGDRLSMRLSSSPCWTGLAGPWSCVVCLPFLCLNVGVAYVNAIHEMNSIKNDVTIVLSFCERRGMVLNGTKKKWCEEKNNKYK